MATNKAETGETPKLERDPRRLFAEVTMAAKDGRRPRRRGSYVS
jgi:hypothetical protein